MNNVGDAVPSSVFSFVAGGPVPQDGGGLGRARTSGSEGAYGISSDEAPACVEETVATKERFCFVLVELYTCHSMSDTTKSIKFTLSSINHLYRSKSIAASSLFNHFNATYASSVI